MWTKTSDEDYQSTTAKKTLTIKMKPYNNVLSKEKKEVHFKEGIKELEEELKNGKKNRR